MPFVIDPGKTGFEKVLRDYQIEALSMVWEGDPKGVTSREVYQHVNKQLGGGKSISRASINSSLNEVSITSCPTAWSVPARRESLVSILFKPKA